MTIDDKVDERPVWHLTRISKPEDLWEYGQNGHLQEFLGSSKFFGIQMEFYRSRKPAILRTELDPHK